MKKPIESSNQFGVLSVFIENLRKKKLDRWKKTLEKRIRIFCKATFPTTPSLIGPQIDGNEITKERQYVIAFVQNNKMTNLYKVKKSHIPGANMGLFAEKSFSQGEVMGVYFGKILKNVGTNEENLSCYAMTSETLKITVDCMGGIESKYHPYFGLQFANDPFLGDLKMTRNRSHDKAHNFFVDDNFVARACLDIRRGEELFLYYGWKDDKKYTGVEDCKCRGCESRRKNFMFE